MKTEKRETTVKEDIVSDAISEDPSDIGSRVDDSISDGDARDLVKSLISNHW